MNTAEKLETKFMKDNHTETRLALLEQSISHINEALTRIEKRFDNIDKKFDTIESKVDKKFDAIDKKLETLREKMDSTTKWLIGLGISVLFSAASMGFSAYQIFTH